MNIEVIVLLKLQRSLANGLKLFFLLSFSASYSRGNFPFRAKPPFLNCVFRQGFCSSQWEGKQTKTFQVLQLLSTMWQRCIQVPYNLLSNSQNVLNMVESWLQLADRRETKMEQVLIKNRFSIMSVLEKDNAEVLNTSTVHMGEPMVSL